MSNQEEAWENLDAEFDHYLVDMKTYVLKLPQKLERQRCALWIKKLCDPSGAGTGVTGRKNRNLYTKLLLHMLKRGVLEGPFSHKPEDGTLKPLPTYMSIYFDEPISAKFQRSDSGGLPDWVLGELESRETKPNESLKMSLNEESAVVTSPTRPRYSYSSKLATRSLSPTQRLDNDLLPLTHTRDSADDSDLEARLNSWNLGIENPRYLREKSAPHIPIDMKIKAMEAKFHEEKLKMQQKHDTDVQKILERKNNEIEEIKTLYRNKQNECDETIRKLEKKVQTLLRESQLIRETKDAQILELKKLCEQSTDTLKNEWEKKLHGAVADMEQEKFELQKKHTENIQELLDDTNARLLKMEADYVSQTKATALTVKELEARVQQLTVEAESSNLQRQRLSQEKAEVEASYQATCSDLQQINGRLTALQKDKEFMSQDYEKQLQQLKKKYDSDITFVTQQNALSAAKASALIDELEQSLSQTKQQGQEREHQSQQEIRELESRFQKEKIHLERHWEKKVHDLRKELEYEREAGEKKIFKISELLKEKDEHLKRVIESHRLQTEQSDIALEEFKRQVASNTEKVYTEMKEQMEKVNADLIQAKSLRQKQMKEFSGQFEELKVTYDQQIAELNLKHEQEKTYLFEQHSAEKERIMKDHQHKMDMVEKQLQNNMLEHEKMVQAWRQDAQLQKNELENSKSQLRASEEKLRDKELDWQEKLRDKELDWQEKLRDKELDWQEKMIKLRLEHERKINGLLPADLTQALEDRIEHLKSQVRWLNKTNEVLRENLNLYESTYQNKRH